MVAHEMHEGPFEFLMLYISFSKQTVNVAKDYNLETEPLDWTQL